MKNQVLTHQITPLNNEVNQSSVMIAPPWCQHLSLQKGLLQSSKRKKSNLKCGMNKRKQHCQQSNRQASFADTGQATLDRTLVHLSVRSTQCHSPEQQILTNTACLMFRELVIREDVLAPLSTQNGQSFKLVACLSPLLPCSDPPLIFRSCQGHFTRNGKPNHSQRVQWPRDRSPTMWPWGALWMAWTLDQRWELQSAWSKLPEVKSSCEACLQRQFVPQWIHTLMRLTRAK